MLLGICSICVANTFTRQWEYIDYVQLADEFDYSITIIECHADHGNIHGAPSEVVEKMRERWEPTTPSNYRRIK